MTITLTRRIKLAFILSPAIFILAAWVFVMSPLASPETVVRALSLAAVLAFAVAYSITLFVSYLFDTNNDANK